MSGNPKKNPPDLQLDLPSYKPPQKGLLTCLPSSWVPYAELIRLTRPIGIIIIHCPFLFGMLFAAAIASPRPSPHKLLEIEAMLLLSTVFLRGSVVAYNDIADREIDGSIARTRHRPMARKAISLPAAYTFVLAQAIIWLAILAHLSPTCIKYAIPSLALAAFYPYSKRFTDFTPVVLGFTMALGVFIGCAATGIDPLSLVYGEPTGTTSAVALLTLYLTCATWTIIYETIYAHQDILDDKKQGVRSMAIRLEGKTKPVLGFLAVLQTLLFASTGWFMGAQLLPFAASCFGVGATLGVMILKIDLHRADHCWWWSSNGTWLVGGNIAVGLITHIRYN